MNDANFGMLKYYFYNSSYDTVYSFFDDIWLNRGVLSSETIKQWEEGKKRMKELVSPKVENSDWPDLESLRELESWVIRVALEKLELHESWEKVNTRLKELRDIAREGLWRKKEKKEEGFQPFTKFVISDVWEWESL